MTRRRKPAPECLTPELRLAIDAAAERAAKRAVTRTTKQILIAIGINSETGVDQSESQKDMHFVRRVRLASESTPAKISFGVFTAFLSLIGGLIILSVQYLFSGK
jgi:hypothetical protein